jgi:uncharacterized membrane protein YqjE
MAGEDSTAGSTRAGGLLGSAKGLAATLIATASTRLQLLANELAAEGLRLRQIVLLLVFAVFFFALAILLLTLLVVVVFWDDHRLLAIGSLAAVYLAVSALLVFAANRCRSAGRRPFEATLGELEKDRARLMR